MEGGQQRRYLGRNVDSLPRQQAPEHLASAGESTGDRAGRQGQSLPHFFPWKALNVAHDEYFSIVRRNGGKLLIDQVPQCLAALDVKVLEGLGRSLWRITQSSHDSYQRDNV